MSAGVLVQTQVPDLGPASPFLPGTQAQYAWDSVCITTAMSCWRRYQLSIIEGWQPKGPSTAIALTFGIAFHRGLERYHRMRAAGLSHDGSLFGSLRLLVRDPEYAALPVADDITDLRANHDEDEDDGIFLRNSRVRTRYHLLRAVVWYLEHYKDDPVSTLILSNGQPAVELSFRMELPDVSIQGHPVLLSGHLDRVGIYDGSLYVIDYKSTKSLSGQFFSAFQLSHQINGYTLAGATVLKQPISGVIIDGIALQIGGVKLSRAPIPRSKEQLAEYLANVRWIIKQAETLALVAAAVPGFDYPMNTTSCYFCQFQQVCQQPPSLRKRYLAMSYERRPAWNPLENR